jgi:hypothetical protein
MGNRIVERASAKASRELCKGRSLISIQIKKPLQFILVLLSDASLRCQSLLDSLDFLLHNHRQTVSTADGLLPIFMLTSDNLPIVDSYNAVRTNCVPF